jgi:hypothetical protein
MIRYDRYGSTHLHGVYSLGRLQLHHQNFGVGASSNDLGNNAIGKSLEGFNGLSLILLS